MPPSLESTLDVFKSQKQLLKAAEGAKPTSPPINEVPDTLPAE